MLRLLFKAPSGKDYIYLGYPMHLTPTEFRILDYIAERQGGAADADELAAREYDRTAASQKTQNELAMKIYEYQHQLEQEAAEAARWERLFRAKYGG